MAQVADLQSWGQCSDCGTNLWVEQSADEQRCACACGAVALHDATKVGTAWAEISEDEFQEILDADALL